MASFVGDSGEDSLCPIGSLEATHCVAFPLDILQEVPLSFMILFGLLFSPLKVGVLEAVLIV